MSIWRRILIAAVFVSALMVSSISFANAQQVPDRLFLEVLDSKGKPVSGATVEHVPGGFAAQERKQLTDEKGSFGFWLPWDSRSENLTSYFTVIKEGFFTYYDIGGSGTGGQSKVQIELFQIPKTGDEEQSLGQEQLKREFMWAAKTGDAETVKKLLKKGISPNLMTSDLRGVSGRKDIPAILFAVLSADAETVETLLKAGANIPNQEKSKDNILMAYLWADPFLWHKPKTEAERKEILQRYEDGVKIFLKAGIDIYAEDSNRNPSSPMTIAAYKGYIQALKLLIARGLPANKDKYLNTLLEYATRQIYDRGTSKDEFGQTSKIETVNYLLKLGANPNENCGAGLGNAASQGDLEVIKALLNHGAKIDLPNCLSPLFRTVYYRQVAAARYLIESGANINVSSEDKNLLMIAAKTENVEMIKLLLEKGFPVNARNRAGATALMYVPDSDADSKKTLETLLEAGANPNLIEGDPQSGNCYLPLLKYANHYSFPFIKLLVEHGADINMACGNGDTVLVVAIKSYQPEVVKELIKYGANVHGQPIDKAISEIKTYYKEGDYYRKYVDETIKIIEAARAGEKKEN